MTQSIKKRLVGVPDGSEREELRQLLNAIQTDLTNLRTATTTATASLDTSFTNLNAAVAAIASRLDTDMALIIAAVPGASAAHTDYVSATSASTGATNFATGDPAALNLTA